MWIHSVEWRAIQSFAPPVLDIASNVGSVVCPDEPVTLTNASTPPLLNTPFGCTEDYTYRWVLDAGLTLLNGIWVQTTASLANLNSGQQGMQTLSLVKHSGHLPPSS